jgi:hypothetical protein
MKPPEYLFSHRHFPLTRCGSTNISIVMNQDCAADLIQTTRNALSEYGNKFAFPLKITKESNRQNRTVLPAASSGPSVSTPYGLLRRIKRHTILLSL